MALPNLETLTPDELRELHARAGLLLRASPGTDGRGVANDAEAMVHRQIAEVFRQLGSPEPPPYRMVMRMKHYKAFQEGVPVLMRYIQRYLKPETVTERTKATRLLVLMLCRRLRRDGVPISHRALTYRLSHVAEVVEDQFPGYRESGLLGVVLRGIRGEQS